MKKLFSLLTIVFVLVFLRTPASAHVTVKPAEVGVGQRLNFAVSVPTEEDNPTVSVRLVIPEGLQSVRPNVKPGWNIQLKKTGEGESAKISEITWSGGSIPAEQRDEFVFNAQAPASQSSLVWKAYQTYSDGDIVAWENDPKAVEEFAKNNPSEEGAEDDHNAPKPYSQTKVINDLAPSPKPEAQAKVGVSVNNLPLILSAIAVILSGFSLGLTLKKR